MSGTVDAALATPDVTRFSPADATGAGAAHARAVARRRPDHRQRRARRVARRRRPRRRGAGGRRPARRSCRRRGPSRSPPTASRSLRITRKSPTCRPSPRSRASRRCVGAALVEGRITGNLAELHTTGTLSLANAAYGDTLRAVEHRCALRRDAAGSRSGACARQSVRRPRRWSRPRGDRCVKLQSRPTTPIGAPRSECVSRRRTSDRPTSAVS